MLKIMLLFSKIEPIFEQFFDSILRYIKILLLSFDFMQKVLVMLFYSFYQILRLLLLEWIERNNKAFKDRMMLQ